MRGKSSMVSNTPKTGSFFKSSLTSGLNFFKKQGQPRQESVNIVSNNKNMEEKVAKD